jgi:hypothetical protein
MQMVRVALAELQTELQSALRAKRLAGHFWRRAAVSEPD